MPCYDPRPEQDARENKRRLDRATRVACELAKVVRKNCPIALKGVSPEVVAWVKAHDTEDARRETEEKAQKGRQALQRKAVGKLTPAERAALGINIKY